MWVKIQQETPELEFISATTSEKTLFEVSKDALVIEINDTKGSQKEIVEYIEKLPLHVLPNELAIYSQNVGRLRNNVEMGLLVRIAREYGNILGIIVQRYKVDGNGFHPTSHKTFYYPNEINGEEFRSLNAEKLGYIMAKSQEKKINEIL